MSDQSHCPIDIISYERMVESQQDRIEHVRELFQGYIELLEEC